MASTREAKMIMKRVEAALEGACVPRLYTYYGHLRDDVVSDGGAVHARTSGDAAGILRPFYGHDIEHREEAWMLLFKQNRVIGCVKVSEGGLAATYVDVRVVMGIALVAQATHIILSHNHPSGQLRPSEQDITLTRKFVEAGRILDIQLYDHVILTREGHFSFADNGML